MVAGGALKLGEFLDTWIASAKKKLEYKTVENYEQVIRDYLKPTLGSRPLNRLRPDEVQKMLDALSERGLSPRTVQNIRAVLRRALNVAVKYRYIEVNPATLVDTPPIRRGEHPPWTSEEVQTFLKAVKGHSYEAVYWTLIYLGLRKGEALALLRADVDLPKKTLMVRAGLQRQKRQLAADAEGPKSTLVRKVTKTQGSTRTLPIPDVLCPVLEAYDKERAAAHPGVAYFFVSGSGTPIEPRNLNRHFDAVVERLKLPKKTIHDLRHQCASELIKAKVDIAQVAAVLGHSTPFVTLTTYAHAFEGELRGAVNAPHGAQGTAEGTAEKQK